MAEKTSADQYAPVRDTERYMDSKGGAGTYKPGREQHAKDAMTQEERRHAAEVGNTERQRKHEAERSGGSGNGGA